jgi:hypothetical protein
MEPQRLACLSRSWSAAALLGALAALLAHPVTAAEWSAGATMSSGVDDDSNRSLTPVPRQSQSAWIYSSFLLQEATETTQLSLAPQLRWQHINDRSFGDIFDRSLTANLGWSGERNQISTSASVADESTLTSELTETGILSSDTHRRLDQIATSGTHALAEHRALTWQLSYSQVSYYGTQTAVLDVLSGYRYPSASLGENFVLSDRTTLSASAFVGELLSRTAGGDTKEAGAQLGWNRQLSERTTLAVTAGANTSSYAGAHSTSMIAALSLNHTTALGGVALSYTHGLAPLGIGALAEQDRLTLSATRTLTERLSGDLSLNGTREDSAPYSAHLRRYGSVSAGLSWRPAETWSARAELSATTSQTTYYGNVTARSVRGAVSLTWTPHPRSRSR